MEQDSQILNERRQTWISKKILKKLYHNWYRIIGSALKPGSILEIGGGSGNLKEFFPHAISSDILFSTWIDAVLDAHFLPFKDAALDNILVFELIRILSAQKSGPDAIQCINHGLLVSFGFGKTGFVGFGDYIVSVGVAVYIRSQVFHPGLFDKIDCHAGLRVVFRYDIGSYCAVLGTWSGIINCVVFDIKVCANFV